MVRCCVLTLVLTCGAACWDGHPPPSETGPPPNVLFAIADDWGWPHAGAYGDPVVRTPTFDRLAAEGILFRHAFVSSPSCTPSRAAILTGQWHWRLEESANLWSTLQTRFPVYPDLLERAGYAIGYTRKGWGPGRFKVGGRTRNPAGPHFEDLRAFLADRKDDAPFTFWFGSNDPHRPYDPGSGAAGGIDPSAIRLSAAFPDSAQVRSDVADYYFEVERFDREVGELMEILEEEDLLQNTIVVMTGDHGMPFPRHKGNLYDTGTRVPLAIWAPDRFKGGRRVDDFVSLTDLAPTILDLAGVAIPEQMTGRSLGSILRSGEEGWLDPSRRFVLTGKERHVPGQETPDQGGTPMRAIRTRDFLYIRNFEPEGWPAGTPNWKKAVFPGAWYADVDNGPTKFYMVDHKDDDAFHRRLFELAFSRRPSEELYDLRSDPDQLENVAGEPAYGEIQSDLSERLLEALRQSKDPRLEGAGERLESYPYYGQAPVAREYEERP